jgi:MFS family permease
MIMSKTTTDRHDGRAAWTAAFAAVAILTIAHGAPLIAVIALKPIAADLGSARGGPSAIAPLTYVGAAVGGILAGRLAERFGARRVVLFGGVMLAAGLVVSTLGGLPSLLVGHGLLMGLFGTACMFSPLMTYVSLWFERRRGAAIALISSGQAISGAIWPLLFEAAISQFGWRATMQAFAGLAIAAISLLALVFLAPPPAPSGVSASTEGGPKSLGTMTSGRMMTLLMLAIFCCCVPMNVPLQHVVAFCGDIGLSSQRGAAMLTLLLGTAFVARQFWGWVADTIGGLRTLLLSSFAQLVTLSGFLLTRDEPALFAVSSAFGFAFSGLLPAYVIAIREYFPAREASWRVPTVLLAGYLGMAFGGWGAGVVYDALGWYEPAFAIGLGFNVVNALALSWLVVRAGAAGDARLQPDAAASRA